MIFNRSKIWAAALLGAVFFAGAAAGWALQAWADSRDDGRRGGRRETTVERLTRQLDLTRAQRDSVRAIIERYRPAFDDLWRETHPRYDSLRALVRGEIMGQLDPEQRERYQRLLADLKHQHGRADSGKMK